MNKFQLFLQQANFKDDTLKGALLLSVDVNSYKKSWTFNIEFSDVPTPESLDYFIESLKLYFTITDVVNNVDYTITFKNESSESQILEYYNWLLEKLINDKSSYSIYKNYQTECKEGKVFLHVDALTKKKNKIEGIMCSLLKKHGIDVNVELLVDEELLTSKDKLKQKKSKAMTEIPMYTKPIEKAETKPASTRSYRRPNSNGKVEDINIIPKTNHELDKYLNTENDKFITVEGKIVEVEVRKLKNTHLLEMIISDDDDAIKVKQFLNKEEHIEQANKFKEDYFVRVSGEIQYDTFLKDVIIMANYVETIEKTAKKVRRDFSKNKRVELHLHTQMSNLDGIGSVREYIDQAIEWGHESIAFTDHDGLYAFPEIAKYSLGKNIKPIYGVELEYIDEEEFKLAFNDEDIDLRKATFVAFDLETTGLSSTRDKIIEISAVKIENMAIVAEFNSFVNPLESLSAFTTELTSITDEDLANAKTISEVLPEFLKFIEGSILVAHNAQFDLGFLTEKTRELGIIPQKYPTIDTINIARYFYSDDLKRFNLKSVARYFKVKLEQHHRAEFDAKATGEVFIHMLADLYKKDVKVHSDINKLIDLNKSWKCGFTNHIVLLAQTQSGYKNLYKLVSETLTDYFYKTPRLTKQTLNKYKEGLLIGSGCYKGAVFEKALYETDEALKEAMKMFDYIEIQPPQAYRHLIEELGADGEFIIESVIRKIVFMAKELNKPIVATGDVHYLNKDDVLYRDIYVNAKLVGGGLHDLAKYEQSPLVYFLTTEEMLDQFAFLGEKTAYEIVVENTNFINQSIQKIEAFPKTLYSLSDDVFKENLGIDSIKEVVEKMVYDNAHKWYGKNLHPIVQKRIEQELKVIIQNEYAPIYYISYLLVKKSKEDGYLVGSRGSVGSSFVATLMEITEVNPLKPHYRCKNNCVTVFPYDERELNGYNPSQIEVDFQAFFDGVYSGYDLPTKKCPVCDSRLIKEGQDIPFETFLGFTGDKIPDIDLNFSGDYQANAHAYVRELIGENYAFRAGTIQTVAKRNAYGYVKGYLETKDIYDVRESRVAALAKRIEGVKRSTGQHPGGIVVVPNHKEIFDITPIQYPANDTNSEWKTTHFDYHSFEDNLLKLDVLGHDDPTVLKFLMDYVSKHPDDFPFNKAEDIPVDDKRVYGLFNGLKSIGLDEKKFEYSIASFGVPEFGTPFVRAILEGTKPSNFAGLVKISGLSHGTDVWAGNARELIKSETKFKEKISFEEIIGCRDDIMVDLMSFGMSPAISFEIMEFVRRGNPAKNKNKWQEYSLEMKRNNVPEWYIWSCGEIKYMFPKAHAAAYVLMAVRIAWFKVYKPIIFYSSFFSIRATQFDHDVMVAGVNAIRNKIKEIERKAQYLQTDKEVNLLITLQVAYEMHLRGFKFLPVDINKSSATTFTIEKNALRMPFISMDGLGKQVAIDVVTSREEKPFKTIKDVNERTKINKTVFENMSKCGAFDDLEEEKDVFSQGLFAL